ncbi:glycoside hydrolase family 92 protein [Rheinheimera riviphila]|uniref:Glycoside hydrolase family 92 protein n=1 Tax=Rheinheimera riviphila TaxID=1834037 RepID=A0A437R0H5_9GAMM|nr:GH92 family glycosyl hydrolase [Rheinheimera riviphila]RVU40221.1 glycoside hydrolase family 92 protein [Rheinheimera riviphila]
MKWNKQFARYLQLSLLLTSNVFVFATAAEQITKQKNGSALNSPSQYVNPFIGTANFGATHPGAQYPQALVSVAPFNVAFEGKSANGDKLNPFEKDAAWNSRGYIFENKLLTGFSHVNLSGVGCPDLGVLLLMPTTGALELDAEKYGSTYQAEQASPGYYRTVLTKYQTTAEVTSTLRSGRSRFTFPAGQANILLNLGLGLTNENGGSLQINSATEVQGSRTIGTFCYHSEQARPVYFVARFNKPAQRFGGFKKMPLYKNVEAEWMPHNNNYKAYPFHRQLLSGDDIGAYFSFDNKADEVIEVELGVSWVSIDNARQNLDAEQYQTAQRLSFDELRQRAVNAWDSLLSRIDIDASSTEKTLFYTALYHSLIHPSIISDINGDYPLMGEFAADKPLFGNNKNQPRYSVFSLWDSNRNVHPLLSLVYPELQSAMVQTMVAMSQEQGWLPKWELVGIETKVMVGDPASVVIADTYLRGIRDFDVQTAYQAMKKAALTATNNPLRPENADYLQLGYVPVDDEGPYDGSVSTSLEYYLADAAIGRLAAALGHAEDAKLFQQKSLNYQKLFDTSTGMLRPKKRNGDWHSPFNPDGGRNFEPTAGYIEGTAWNYRFYVPHDVPGLIKLLGEDEFVRQLDLTFDSGKFDMANEPDITYPFLYNYLGQTNQSSARVQQLIKQHYHNTPAGLPGNDDTGTLSSWLVFSMLGLYPTDPGNPTYTLFEPAVKSARISLNPAYYPGKTLEIQQNAASNSSYSWQEKALKTPFISHQQLVQGGVLRL